MTVKELKNWVLKKNLVETSMESFWEAFNYWKNESPKEFRRTFKKTFDPEKLFVYVNTVSLTITNWPAEDYNHVVITIRFEYNETSIGEYKMMFHYETGEIEDDSLSIHNRI